METGASRVVVTGLHRFKNEHYWFGVTNHLGDRALRTYPTKAAVETSPTCRTLDVAVD